MSPTEAIQLIPSRPCLIFSLKSEHVYGYSVYTHSCFGIRARIHRHDSIHTPIDACQYVHVHAYTPTYPLSSRADRFCRPRVLQMGARAAERALRMV